MVCGKPRTNFPQQISTTKTFQWANGHSVCRFYSNASIVCDTLSKHLFRNFNTHLSNIERWKRSHFLPMLLHFRIFGPPKIKREGLSVGLLFTYSMYLCWCVHVCMFNVRQLFTFAQNKYEQRGCNSTGSRMKSVQQNKNESHDR